MEEIAAVTGGRLLAGDPGATVTGAANDTRTLPAGALFVALRAERDGHDFLADALDRGAAGLLVSAAPPEPVAERIRAAGAGVVQVADTAAALSALGAHARDRLGDVPVVGITGSTGKTSTKDLTAAALASRSPLASEASFNNEIGVPLTLLSAAGNGAVVVEMGSRGKGHIAALCTVARPTVGAITNIGMAHAEFFGSRAEVAAGKGELLEALPATGTAVLCADCDMTPGLAARTAAAVLTVGHRDGADVRVSDLRLDAELRPTFRLDTPWGGTEIRDLPMRGRHAAVNAAFAVAIAGALGVTPAEAAAGLAGAVGSRWRMELVRTGGGLVVLNDAYNANPSSMTAALDALRSLDAAHRYAVLGQMAELGEHSGAEHAAVGRLAAASGLTALVVVGPEAKPLAEAAAADGLDVVEVADATEALDTLTGRLEPGDAVLVKASRVAGLERVAAALVDWSTP
jgi:UDP-N-acetylmuramoyl-tripeptide--D-alanyl-D-alanine ligase